MQAPATIANSHLTCSAFAQNAEVADATESEEQVDIFFRNPVAKRGEEPLLHSNCSAAKQIAALVRYALLRYFGDELTEKVAAILNEGKQRYGWKFDDSWLKSPQHFLDQLEAICSGDKSDEYGVMAVEYTYSI